jgi:hypothetical protein
MRVMRENKRMRFETVSPPLLIILQNHTYYGITVENEEKMFYSHKTAAQHLAHKNYGQSHKKSHKNIIMRARTSTSRKIKA